MKIMVEVDQQLITNQLQSWIKVYNEVIDMDDFCLLYTSPSPRDMRRSRMPSSA